MGTPPEYVLNQQAPSLGKTGRGINVLSSSMCLSMFLILLQPLGKMRTQQALQQIAISRTPRMYDFESTTTCGSVSSSFRKLGAFMLTLTSFRSSFTFVIGRSELSAGHQKAHEGSLLSQRRNSHPGGVRHVRNGKSCCRARLNRQIRHWGDCNVDRG